MLRRRTSQLVRVDGLTFLFDFELSFAPFLLLIPLSLLLAALLLVLLLVGLLLFLLLLGDARAVRHVDNVFHVVVGLKAIVLCPFVEFFFLFILNLLMLHHR